MSGVSMMLIVSWNWIILDCCSKVDLMSVFVLAVSKRGQWVDKNHMVLFGHRSIVNHVRYNPQRGLLASSGVEKVIKVR